MRKGVAVESVTVRKVSSIKQLLPPSLCAHSADGALVASFCTLALPLSVFGFRFISSTSL